MSLGRFAIDAVLIVVLAAVMSRYQQPVTISTTAPAVASPSPSSHPPATPPPALTPTPVIEKKAAPSAASASAPTGASKAPVAVPLTPPRSGNGDPTLDEDSWEIMTYTSPLPLPPYAEYSEDVYDRVLNVLLQSPGYASDPFGSSPYSTVSQYRYEPRHTGIAPPGATCGRYYELVWNTTQKLNNDTYGASKSSPILTPSGRIYIGTDRSTLVGVNRTTGQVEAELYLDAPYHQKGIHGTPSYSRADDRLFGQRLIFVGDYTGKLYAFNLATGKKQWRVKLGGSLGSSPVPYEGLVMIGVELNMKTRVNGDGWLSVVDARTGAVVWKSPPIGGHPHATPTINPSNHYVYLGGNAGRFVCWDLSPLICNRTSRVRQAALLSANSLETSCDVAELHPANAALKAGELRTVFEFEMGKHPFPPDWPADANSTTFENEIKSTAALHPLRDLVYTNSWDFRIYCLNALTGVEVWNFLTQSRVMSSVSIDPTRELVVVGGLDGFVYGLDALTGVLRWRVETEDSVRSSATLLLEDGVALIGSSDKYIYVIDLDDGSVRELLETGPGGVTGVPVAVDNELYAFDHLGHLSKWQAVLGTPEPEDEDDEDDEDEEEDE